MESKKYSSCYEITWKRVGETIVGMILGSVGGLALVAYLDWRKHGRST